MQRIICPLNVRYGRRHVVLGESRENKSSINCAIVDALEMIEASCDGGTVRRLCARVSVRVPWTPVLFVAVRNDRVSEVRSEINLCLAMSVRSNATDDGVGVGGVVATAHMGVCGLVRAHDRILWRKRENMTLYELSFESHRDRTIARRYLEANATNGLDRYLLFAIDCVTFEIALASHLRKRDRKNVMNISDTFEMFRWCRVDTSMGNSFIRLSVEEIALHGLSENPLSVMPIVSYDIETIADDLNAVPRGVERCHRLSSISFTMHSPSHGLDRATLALAYTPLTTDEKLRDQELRLQSALDAYETTPFTIKLYRDERTLLMNALDILRRNSLLVELYKLDDPSIARRLACVLLGYNSWDYDYTFLWCRANFYGWHDTALSIYALNREPRFCPSQISIDLMKHVVARYRTQVGSVALSHVSRYFGASESSENDLSARAREYKMSFDAVRIRHLYYDIETSSERFDEETAFARLDPDSGLNMLRVLRYNAQDCAAVYYLARNLALFDTIALYARHFMTPLVDASHVGNSRLLPNAFVARALDESRVVLHHRSNVRSGFIVKRSIVTKNALGELYESLSPKEQLDFDVTKELLLPQTTDASIIDERALMRINGKAYIGGVNSAESGHYECPITVDFASFYPSIGCQFGLSMETVNVLTVQQLLREFRSSALIDAAILSGGLRVFEYEPIDSKFVRTINNDGSFVLHGRNELANEVLRSTTRGWYEGFEFSNVKEMINSSVDIRSRRVLTVYHASPAYVPVISGLWKHYLNMRKYYKSKLRESRDQNDSTIVVAKRHVYECMEKMYKVTANSLYGYLNYERSAVFAPAVAAAITLMSRKTFHETTWICENLFPRSIAANRRRSLSTTLSSSISSLVGESIFTNDSSQWIRDCRVVYRDTDGLIVRLLYNGANDNVEIERIDRRSDLIVLEKELVALVNRVMARYGNTGIVIELDDSGVRMCSIMGKKKYWKAVDGRFLAEAKDVVPDPVIVTKGFEKNAQAFVKYIVRALQINVLTYVKRTVRVPAFRLIVNDVISFFVSLYAALHSYYSTHGLASYAFNVPLNPRACDSVEARFIHETLTRCNYAIGDRAKCVFALNVKKPDTVSFRLLRDFDERRDRLNYYRFIRRYAVYFLQLVEGFKRFSNEDSVDVPDRCRMTAREFDQALVTAYTKWLDATTTETTIRPYDGLFLGASASIEERERCLRILIDSAALNSEPLSM